MKWWGWGDPDQRYPMKERPKLWPFIEKKLGLENARPMAPPSLTKHICLPKAKVTHPFLADLHRLIRSDQATTDDMIRLERCYGKSYPNLLLVRSGVIRRAPDLVIFPESEKDVQGVIKLAVAHSVAVIPFGGGTNIVGGVDPREGLKKFVVTLDMRRMNKVIDIDRVSATATIQAGISGPDLESHLGTKGYALGHYPDSFEYSTLGGWLATRSAGMQSDEYGKIEDMVLAMRMVSPSVTFRTRSTPASSAGPDINQIICGSEGIFGVITEATMQIHPTPTVKDYFGVVFPSFDDGVRACQEMVATRNRPSMIRLQDEAETELAMHMKPESSFYQHMLTKPLKAFLRARGYTYPSVMVVGFEGEPESVKTPRRQCQKIIRRNHGFLLGRGVGRSWYRDKFLVPYLRDYIMNYRVMVDVAETAAHWNELMPLYHKVKAAIEHRFSVDGESGYVGCHVSHTYKSGACLYFTYAVKQQFGRELQQYYDYKDLITSTIMQAKGTLTHHHAIGYEHMRWLPEEISQGGMTILRGLKKVLDPTGVMNPGKLISDCPEQNTIDFGNEKQLTRLLQGANLANYR